MPTPSLCVIHNPTAGRGFSRFTWKKLHRLLDPHADFRPTQGPEHAVELAEAAAREGFPTIVAAGGDGTVHEVANGLLRVTDSPSHFGVLPLGSGNDYARMLHLPKGLEQQVTRLLSFESWAVDAGRVLSPGGRRERYFVNTIGFGLSGVVTWESRQIRGLRGVPLYGLAALKAIYRSFRATPTELVLDEEAWPQPTLYFSVAIGQSEGAGFVVAPDAKIDDGWFDYLHAGPMTRLSALGYMPRMVLGKLPETGGPIRRGRCQRLTIVANEPLHCHTDGELFSDPTKPAQRFEVTLLPGALKIRGAKPVG